MLLHSGSQLNKSSSFEAVAAVSDGLKAWEVLKAKAENIDLILTEVELPSISGYALLTLIMEHDICKNIPVISAFIYAPCLALQIFLPVWFDYGIFNHISLKMQ